MVRFHLLPPKYLSGGITQLVECLLCKQNVAGSNPTTSTNSNMYLKHFCSLKIGSWKLKRITTRIEIGAIDNRLRSPDGFLWLLSIGTF